MSIQNWSPNSAMISMTVVMIAASIDCRPFSDQ